MFWVPDRLAESAWFGHIPFAFWMVDALRPGVIAELGTHQGTSYSAFCQAVQRLKLETRCFAVDTWKGDDHAGFYGEDVFKEFREYHDPRYGAFSRLVRSTFDDAAEYLPDQSVDLLHIDGCHTYAAVRHDFETWQRKLSKRSVVLFHDTNVRERHFGVWRLWEELIRDYPSFEFLHSHGLGVLGYGAELPEPVCQLLAASHNAQITAEIRARFARLGDSLSALFQARGAEQIQRQLAMYREKVEALKLEACTNRERNLELQQEIAKHNSRIDDLVRQVNERGVRIGELLRKTEELDQHVGHLTSENMRSSERHALDISEQQAALAEREKEITRLRDSLRGIQGGMAWKVISVVERIAGTSAKVLRTKPLARSGARLSRTQVRSMKDEISQSKLFDRKWYLLQYGAEKDKGTHLIEDYILFGIAEGRDPNPLFDSSWYLEQYADVAAAGINPLLHYIRHGATEGRDPCAVFDSDWYLKAYPDIAEAELNPLFHYIQHGVDEGRDPNPVFDTDWYSARYPDVATTGLNPLAHYVLIGAKERRDPNSHFNAAWYLRRYPESQSSLSALVHYLAIGRARGYATQPQEERRPSEDINRTPLAVQPSYQTGNRRVAVYTALVGPYDKLFDPHVVPSNCDFLVYTDQVVANKIWQCRPLPYLDADNCRTARFIKLHPHLLLPEYELSVWVDANLEIIDDLTPYLKRIQPQHYIATWRHPHRSTVHDEAEACIELHKEDVATIREQVSKQVAAGFPDKSGLFESSVVVRCHNDQRSIGLMTAWWKEICNGSRRDQVSLPFVLWQQGRAIQTLRDDKFNMRNDPCLSYHRHTGAQGQTICDKTFGRTPTGSKVEKLGAVTIGICIHNGLSDVQRCLSAVFAVARSQDEIILIDDGSEVATRDYLTVVASRPGVRLVRHDRAGGYTKAANKVLLSATRDFIILLNSDTVPTAGFIEKLLLQINAHPRIGIVGPISNAASWQSIPELTGPDGHFVVNDIPPMVSLEMIDRLCVAASEATGPIVPLVNGFCFMMRRSLVDEIGILDEQAFPDGYGEENDYCFRAQDAGYLCLLATDTFVYHAKSKSYGSTRRQQLSLAGAAALKRKYTPGRIERSTATMRLQPTLAQIRREAKDFYGASDNGRSVLRCDTRLRVGCFVPGRIDQPNGSTVVRLLERLEHPCVADRFDYELLPQTPDSLDRLASFDLVIVQRHAFGGETFSRFALALAKSGVPMIYEVDDNLVDYPAMLTAGQTDLWAEQLQKLPMLALRTIVSTEGLAKVYGRYCRHVSVVRNALSERLWLGSSDGGAIPQIEIPNGPTRFLYMGTYTHARDLEVLLPAFEQIAQRRGGIELCLVGIDRRSDSAFIRSIDVPNGWSRYDRFVPWLKTNAHNFSIAVAPLEDNSFTRCKSDLKFLEYSMLGLPGLYSRVGPYASSVQDGVTGILVENTVSSWIEALENALRQSDQMQLIANQATAHVQQQGLLGQSMVAFVDLLQEVAKTRCRHFSGASCE